MIGMASAPASSSTSGTWSLEGLAMVFTLAMWIGGAAAAVALGKWWIVAGIFVISPLLAGAAAITVFVLGASLLDFNDDRRERRQGNAPV
jgi:phosphate/sulfate permease